MLKWKVHSPDRLLSFIKKNFNDFSVKDLRWAIEHNRCSVNGSIERFCSFSLQSNDEVILWPEKRPSLKWETSRVLFEDKSLIAYDKPPYCESEVLAKLFKLFLIHRLDRDTSGILLLAKSEKALENFQNLFRTRSIDKRYLAIIEGELLKKHLIIEEDIKKSHPREGVVRACIVKKGRGLWSKTHIECLKSNPHASLVECRPITGRTHQIRVHLKSVGHPLMGDFEYGKRLVKQNLFRPLLHAKKVEFIHPITDKKVIIEALLPEDFTFWQVQLGL